MSLKDVCEPTEIDSDVNLGRVNILFDLRRSVSRYLVS